ncbi:ABC transporter ATP-binding protein, partial [Streptomyces sp. SID10244]|nr:ABC transporter ATP-binding protein [Streptomyces sp. SID10244]
RDARKAMNRLERQIQQLDTRESRLHDRLLDAATDPEKLMELNAELKDVVEAKEAAEAEWLEVAEKVE